MRFFDNGSCFTVTISQAEVADFKDRWPASGLGAGPYRFQFEKHNGDLIDVAGPGASSWADGPALRILSEAAYEYGKKRVLPEQHGRVRAARGTQKAKRTQ